MCTSVRLVCLVFVSLIFLFLALLPTAGWPQDYDWHLFEIASPQNPAQRLSIRRLTTGDRGLGETPRLTYLIGPAPDRDLTPLTCTNLDRSPNAARLGPDCISLTNGPAPTFGCTDELVSPTTGQVFLAAVTLAADGTCTSFSVPGSVNTQLQALADDGSSAGTIQNPTPAGLARFHGYVRAADGTVTILEGACPPPKAPEWLDPVDMNSLDTLVGKAACNIRPDNTSTTAAWAVVGGIYQLYVAPDGDELHFVSVNSTDQAAGWTQGHSYLIDLRTGRFTDMPHPPGVPGNTVDRAVPIQYTDLGWWLVQTTERLPDCPPPTNPLANCFEQHTWLGLPTVPPPTDPAPTPTTPPAEEPKRLKRSKDRRQVPKTRQHHAKEADDTEAMTEVHGWQPVLTEKGTVELENNGRRVGD